jgi:glutathione peroxidase-family protein
MFAKVDVKGPEAHVIFRYLTREAKGILGSLKGSPDVASRDYAWKKVCDAIAYRNRSKEAFELTNKCNTADLARMGVSK